MSSKWERGLKWTLLCLAAATLIAAILLYRLLPAVHGRYIAELGTAAGTIGLALITVAILIDNRRLGRSTEERAQATDYLTWEPYLRVQHRSGSGGLGDTADHPYREGIGLRNVGNGPAIGIVYLSIREENPDDWDWYTFGPIDLAAGEYLGDALQEKDGGHPIELTNQAHTGPPPVDPKKLPIHEVGHPTHQQYRVVLCRDRFGRRLRFRPNVYAVPEIKVGDNALDDLDRWYDKFAQRRT